MYSYEWDSETGGLLLNNTSLQMSKEPRPVYYKELDALGFDKYWNYDKDDSYPYMWAEANTYIYRGRVVAKTIGGTMYKAPEIVIIDNPELNNGKLRFVDIGRMVEKNRSIMEQISHETIKRVYKNFVDYKKKVDCFYVAFSGGKDSVVVLDIVQRALPHNEFDVMFGNTDMEFKTTINLAEKIKKYCQEKDINFYEAKSEMRAVDSWDLFGPPARRIRWCCTVHKTAPVINKLCEVYGMKKIKSMMITGVRGDESISRSNYDELSLGKKLAGQYSYHPILEWSAAEVYLYIYMNDLYLNDAYKMGFNRVGCIMCPNSSEKHEYIKQYFFKNDVEKFTNKIIKNSSKDLSGDNAKEFIEIGGWKTRLSGRELALNEEERFELTTNSAYHQFRIIKLNESWKTWYKTIGDLQSDGDGYLLEYNGVYRRCSLSHNDKYDFLNIENLGNSKNTIEFISLFKSVLAKSQYCIFCKTCVAECPFRNIEMKNNTVRISDACVRCHSCLEIPYGCLLYNSIKGSKKMKSITGINRYLSVGVDANWIKEYAKDNSFEPGNRKTDSMIYFMSDAKLIEKRKLTRFGGIVLSMDLDDNTPWALMLCNLVYTPAFGWYNKNIQLNQVFLEGNLDLLIEGEENKKKRREFWDGFKIILDSNPAFQMIGFGIPEIQKKYLSNGETRKSLLSIYRTSWEDPNPLVILYSLYLFAEKCGDYYQFSLSRLLNSSIESDGISPAQIFGLYRDNMEKILQGLAINYPDFISVSFTLDLDNINLKKDKTSDDVLELFMR